MVLSLTPEMDDQAEGKLHSGRAGQLLDAMLRAIGHDRSQCYLASLALTRPPGGRIDAGDMAALTPLLWHHLRLARPEKLLIFGTDLAQLAAGTDPSAARGQLLFINHDGVKVEAVAIQHPLLLLDRPARKAAAWDSLKRFAQG
jgi:DNA polymerase